jgi:hypothetical protein
MKHYSPCWECENAGFQDVVWAVGELTNDLYAICVCSNGHRFISGSMHHVPDILYMSAIRAFRNECYSESILSFTAAFERMCELFFKAFCLKNDSNLELIEEMWNEIKNQSERQYGSFCLAYCITAKKAWKADKKQIEFRNSVVHKGYIAVKSEAELYAEYITEKLDDIIEILNTKFEEECRELYFYNKRKLEPILLKIQKENPDIKFSASGIPSLLAWNDGNRKPVSFQNALRRAEDIELRFGH